MRLKDSIILSFTAIMLLTNIDRLFSLKALGRMKKEMVRISWSSCQLYKKMNDSKTCSFKINFH